MPAALLTCRDVHDDCYKVVSYYIEETAGADIKARMLDFYLRLVEPFFGLPERQHTTTAHKGEHQHHEMSADSDSDEEGDKPGEEGGRALPAKAMLLSLLCVYAGACVDRVVLCREVCASVPVTASSQLFSGQMALCCHEARRLT